MSGAIPPSVPPSYAAYLAGGGTPMPAATWTQLMSNLQQYAGNLPADAEQLKGALAVLGPFMQDAGGAYAQAYTQLNNDMNGANYGAVPGDVTALVNANGGAPPTLQDPQGDMAQALLNYEQYTQGITPNPNGGLMDDADSDYLQGMSGTFSALANLPSGAPSPLFSSQAVQDINTATGTDCNAFQNECTQGHQEQLKSDIFAAIGQL